MTEKYQRDPKIQLLRNRRKKGRHKMMIKRGKLKRQQKQNANSTGRGYSAPKPV